MCSVVAFFPGKRRLTNGMLDDLRAAGFYAGKGSVLGWKPKKDFDGFATETAAIRQMVALRFRGHSVKHPGSAGLHVLVWVTGHEKQDPDAWLLLGKAAVDGLVDAGLVRRDRDGVDLVGRVDRGDHASLIWLMKHTSYSAPMVGRGEGFSLSITDAECGCAKVQELRGGS